MKYEISNGTLAIVPNEDDNSLIYEDNERFIVMIYQATAYYYHGLILDEGNTEKSHGMAVAALQAADPSASISRWAVSCRTLQ